MNFVAALAFFLISGPGVADRAGDVAQLTAGVQTIDGGGAPGPLCAYGPEAFPVALGQAGAGVRLPVAGATRLGEGRVVAYGHGSFLSQESLAKDDSGRFLINAIGWVAPARPIGKIAVFGNPGAANYLRSRGLNPLDFPRKDLANRLDGMSVVIADCGDWSASEIDAVQKWVAKGGGLITASLGWGWMQVHRANSLDAHPGNLLLGPAGLIWADGTLDGPYTAIPKPMPLAQAGEGLTALEATAPLGKADATQALGALTSAMNALPADDAVLLPRLRRLVSEREPHLPATVGDPLNRLAVAFDAHQAAHVGPRQVRASPLAATFPGVVPEGAKRVERTVTVDTSIPRWHSTGLYAAPGDLITIHAPDPAVNAGLRVRINAHTDQLWGHPKWDRSPQISRQFPIASATTEAANAFGGLIYLDVPRDCKLGTIEVTIRGAVEAPYYVEGQTSLGAWKRIRENPAPWGELQTENVILTLPASVLRTLDRPDRIAKFWSEAMHWYSVLATLPEHRASPERYCPDRQISAGYMHSGYPIMTWMDVAPAFVDLHLLTTNGDGKGGDWGFFHEMGHNHQVGDWTFDGTGEVTNNIFALFLIEKMCHQTSDAHSALNPKTAREKMVKYFAGGARYEEWKADPFLALETFVLLQKAFGWDAFKTFFAEYHNLPRAERPRNDLEKRDQWMVRFSRIVHRNLGPYFTTWGIPTSQAARDSIKDLPSWSPPDFPPVQTEAR